MARAFQEGGVRKARLKLAKVIAVARMPGESVPSEKKRRRRANQRERASLNRQGALTDVQLFTLFASQHDNWQRMRAWLDERSAQRSKARRQAKWADEYSLFRVQFSDHISIGGGGGGGADLPSGGSGGADVPSAPNAPSLFIASVTQALLRPPDERAAAELWAVLDREHFAGSRVGAIAAVPLGADNVGRRMLLAMGWRAGTGLCSSADGIVEPVAECGDPATPRHHRGLGFCVAGKRKRERAPATTQ